MAGKFEKQKPKSHKSAPNPKGRKTLLIVLAVILALVVALVVGGVVYYNHTLNKLNKVKVPEINYTQPASEPTQVPETQETTQATTEATTEATEPHVASREDYINILVVGQDARVGEENHLADTMILCTINTYEKTLMLHSIPRDTYVEVSGSYKTTSGATKTWGGVKMNMMYANGYQWDGTAGAMAVLNQALYDNFGVEVDYDVEIDFEAFIKAINLLGGIDIELTEAEAKYLNDDKNVWLEVTPGKNWLEGETALAYARMRKAEGDSDSDLKRTSRQRNVIAAVLKKVRSMDLATAQNLINEVLPLITVSMNNSEITSLITTLLPILTDLEITSSGTCPNESWGEMKDLFGNGQDHSILRFSPTSVKKYMRALTLGEGTVE